MKERALGLEFVGRIEALGFDVLSALGEESPDDAPPEEVFRTNVELIRRSDVFVAVLGNHGKDLSAEVGMAYAWGYRRWESTAAPPWTTSWSAGRSTASSDPTNSKMACTTWLGGRDRDRVAPRMNEGVL